MKTNLYCILLLLLLISIAFGQKTRPLISPGKSLTGQNDQGFCNVDFYSGETLAYTASTDHFNTLVTRNSLERAFDNKITRLEYYGTRYFLWIEIFKYPNYQGPNIGFWTQETSGSFDLTYFNSFDYCTNSWFNWSKAVSSYTVYYY